MRGFTTVMVHNRYDELHMCEAEPVAFAFRAGMGNCISNIRDGQSGILRRILYSYIAASDHRLQQGITATAVAAQQCARGTESIVDVHTITFCEMLPFFAPMATGHPEPGQKPRPLMGLP